MRELSSYAAYLFDMDGTLTYQDRAIPGAIETLHVLKAAGKHVLTVTNNSSLGQHALADRFRRFGLPLQDHEVFSAVVAAARLVAHEKPGARVHVFGNAGLRSEMERHGLTVADGEDVDYVVVGNHRGITYDRLTTAMRALMRGARFVTVNMDRTYVGADGDLVPGCGVFATALAYAIGRGPDVVVGKPSITLLCEAAASVDAPASECLYVGDNPEADVGGAHAAGMHALLVLTGVATSADQSTAAPEHVLPSVADLRAHFA
jgi:HAD superfamily hydrolase (TIGR01450 family)